jgi:hypothetical protein
MASPLTSIGQYTVSNWDVASFVRERQELGSGCPSITATPQDWFGDCSAPPVIPVFLGICVMTWLHSSGVSTI